jgi:hypothetical protein
VREKGNIKKEESYKLKKWSVVERLLPHPPSGHLLPKGEGDLNTRYKILNTNYGFTNRTYCLCEKIF